MKCSGPFGELGRWQYNYTVWSLMSYTIITSLLPEAKAGWTCGKGGSLRQERCASFSPCICFFFGLNYLISGQGKWLLMSLIQPVFSLVCSVWFFSSDPQSHKFPYLLHDMRKQCVLYNKILCLVLAMFGRFVLQHSLKMGQNQYLCKCLCVNDRFRNWNSICEFLGSSRQFLLSNRYLSDTAQ